MKYIVGKIQRKKERETDRQTDGQTGGADRRKREEDNTRYPIILA